MVEETRRRLGSHKEATVVAYGHLGDGNLHLNVSVPEYSDDVLACIEPFVYEYTAKHKGSISAEHGKKLCVQYDTGLTFVFQKRLFLDPAGVLNEIFIECSW